MLKNKKRWITVALICLAAGFILCVAGKLSGGKGKLVINGKGIQTSDLNDFDYKAEGNIDKIFLDADNVKVNIERSDDEYVRVHICDYKDAEDIKVSEENGQFKVEDKDNWGINFGFDFSTDMFKSTYATVYIPEDMNLSELEIYTNNGKIESAVNMEVGRLTLKTSNGKVLVSNIKVRESSYISTDNGRIECDGIFNGTSHFVTSNGKVDAKGSYTGEAFFESSNGKIDIETDRSINDYNINASTSNGNVYINDEKKSESYEKNTGAQNSLDINTSNGRINLQTKN